MEEEIEQQQQHPGDMETAGATACDRDNQAATMSAKAAARSCSADPKRSTSVSNHKSESLFAKEMESSAEYCGGGGSLGSSSEMSDADSRMVSEKQQMFASSHGFSTGKAAAGGQGVNEEEGCSSMPEERGDESEWSEAEVSVQEVRNEEPEHADDEYAIANEGRSAATAWTDDKHSSYLNSMEAMFVRNMYGSKYSQPVDDAEEDCADSDFMSTFDCCTSNSIEFFELLQGGCYQQRAFYKPHTLEPAIPSAPAVFASPWIQHFNAKVVMGSNGTCPVEPNSAEISFHKLCPLTVPEGTNESDGNKQEQTGLRDVEEDKVVPVDDETGGIEDLTQNMLDGSTDIPGADQGLRVWQNRLQCHVKSLVAGSGLKKDARSPVQKRPMELELAPGELLNPHSFCIYVWKGDLCQGSKIALADDTFLPKKSKSQHLARKDWEMLKHYVAGQWNQSEWAQATISPQPEQDSLDPQSSEPKTGMQATGEVVPLQVKACNTDTEVDGTSHLTESTLSSCITSPMHSKSPALKVSGEEHLVPEGASNSAAAPTALTLMKEDGIYAPLGAGKLLDCNSHEGHGALDGCLQMKNTLKTSIMLGKSKQGLKEEEPQTSTFQLMQSGEVGEAEECEADHPMSSKARTWIWGLEGPRRRVHEPTQTVPSS